MGGITSDKAQILKMLTEVFERWEELLAGMSEEQITDPNLPSNLSVKDVIAHLWAWQQLSVARQEAALRNGEPEYPHWFEMFGSDPEEDVDRTNAWIYETNHDRPWRSVYADWKAQFLRLLELAEAVPERDLLDPSRYAWMEGAPLSASLLGSFDHHEEHIEPFRARLGWNGIIRYEGREPFKTQRNGKRARSTGPFPVSLSFESSVSTDR